MAYTILSTETNVLTTIFTLVKFDFLDEPINIAHTNPTGDEDIQAGISNREITERRKLLEIQ